MSVLRALFGRENPNQTMHPLYAAIVTEARQTHWYEHGDVSDTIDGRFDMIAVILSLVLIRLENDEEARRESAWLTELFVSDMDGQLRQIGIGEMVVGKHIGKMMSALGGRLGAYRDSLKGEADLNDALLRNLYRGEAPDPKAMEHMSNNIVRLFDALKEMATAHIIEGTLPESEE